MPASRLACRLILMLVFGVGINAVAAAETPPDFLRDVMPVLTKSGCNGGKCHGSFQGRGGFQLSLFGFDAVFDYDAVVKQARGRRVSVAAPHESLLLQKPSSALPHGGGTRFIPDDDAYRILEEWIAKGSLPPRDPNLHVEAIEVTPSEIIADTGETVELRVAARWSDGIRRDVTDWAVYECRDEKYAVVDRAGIVTAASPGRTFVTVTYMGQVAAVPITVPYAAINPYPEFPARNVIDELVSAEWRKLGLLPAPLSTDEEFLRRVYLDLIGTLPTPDEVRAFLADDDPGKRAAVIDALLERPEYVDYWAYKWADLLRVHRRYVGEKGLWTFWSWVRQAVRENRPINDMARELLTSQGSLYSNGATAYYHVDAKPEELAETTSQLFLGVRLQCARCHHHPYEVWSQEDYYGLANFFSRIEIKENNDGGRYGGAKLLRAIETVNRDRRTKVSVPPSLLGQSIDEDGAADIRVLLADWITSPDNPYFSRNFVNRYWAYMMGRGLVEPIDDLRATNPPSHPALLEALNREFVAHGMDAKSLLRLICNSRVYQLAAEAVPQRDRDGMFYTHRKFRRLPATVLLDAVNQAAETTETFAGLPAGTRAVSLPDPAVQSGFLDTFGRSVRSSPCECATSTAPDLAQTLHLVNNTGLHEKVSAPTGRIARLLKSDQSDEQILDELFLATFSRFPTEGERTRTLEFLTEAPSRNEAWEDILWTLLNATDFVFTH